MVGTLLLKIKFISKFEAQIETVHVCNRATCFRTPWIDMKRLFYISKHTYVFICVC